MPEPRTAIVYSPEYQKHATPPGHPERPQRAEAVRNGLREAGLEGKFKELLPTPAREEDILRVHTRAYYHTAKNDVESGLADLSTGDTNISEHSLAVALLAAGGVMQAVDAVVTGKMANAFCVVRPPGHHATPTKGMGFCLFNNIAIGARYAQARHKIGKILIADWDVHHGNGTQDTFYEDASTLFFDCHQDPWYPGTGHADETGSGKGLGLTINCPFPAGSGRKEIYGAFEAKLLDAANKFKPDLVMLSAGFDSRLGDPLGNFRLTDEDYEDITKVLLHIAKEHAESRFVSVLEGGYSLSGLAKGSAAHVKTLLG